MPLEKLTQKLDGEINKAFTYGEDESISDGRIDQNAYDRKRAQLIKGISVDDERLGNRFRRRQVGTIDVWWLFDDGGNLNNSWSSNIWSKALCLYIKFFFF